MDGLKELRVEEEMLIDGGIGSAEMFLVAAICFSSLSPATAIVVATLEYVNTKVIENWIEYPSD